MSTFNRIEVIKPGALSTLQDLGRTGFQRFGVPVCGAMDEWSHRTANFLVGNEDSDATLEITLMGPSLGFAEGAVIAITGADLSPRLGETNVPLGVPIVVPAGGRLDFGRRVWGMRAYLAIRGGFSAQPVMGSRSTYLRGIFGGIDGRALRKGDVLVCERDGGYEFTTLPTLLAADRHLFGADGHARSAIGESGMTARVLRAGQWDAFKPDAQQSFLADSFHLSPQSDRMGYRFQGPKLSLRQPLEMVSEAVCFGTVQVPPDGSPIVLMADRQTTGGYPKIAYVASVDLPLLAQLAPQQTVRFTAISIGDAQDLYLERERTLSDIGAKLKARWRSLEADTQS